MYEKNAKPVKESHQLDDGLSLDYGESTYYQESRRHSSSSLQTALYGGIVTADGTYHREQGLAPQTGLHEPQETVQF